MGWFLPGVPHPVVVWEVVVNNDCEMWSHRDGFPGVGSSGLVSGGFWVYTGSVYTQIMYCVYTQPKSVYTHALCVYVTTHPGNGKLPGIFANYRDLNYFYNSVLGIQNSW